MPTVPPFPSSNPTEGSLFDPERLKSQVGAGIDWVAQHDPFLTDEQKQESSQHVAAQALKTLANAGISLLPQTASEALMAGAGPAFGTVTPFIKDLSPAMQETAGRLAQKAERFGAFRAFFDPRSMTTSAAKGELSLLQRAQKGMTEMFDNVPREWKQALARRHAQMGWLETTPGALSPDEARRVGTANWRRGTVEFAKRKDVADVASEFPPGSPERQYFEKKASSPVGHALTYAHEFFHHFVTHNPEADEFLKDAQATLERHLGRVPAVTQGGGRFGNIRDTEELLTAKFTHRFLAHTFPEHVLTPSELSDYFGRLKPKQAKQVGNLLDGVLTRWGFR